MNRTILLAALMLGACRPVVPDGATWATPSELEAVDAAVAVWTRHGHRFGARCEIQRATIRVARDADDFAAVCGVPPRSADRSCPQGAARCAVGCYELARLEQGTALREDRATVVFGVAPELDDRDADRVLVHEAFHWLGACSGDGGEDSWHVDESRWGDAATYPEGGYVAEALEELRGSR